MYLGYLKNLGLKITRHRTPGQKYFYVFVKKYDSAGFCGYGIAFEYRSTLS